MSLEKLYKQFLFWIRLQKCRKYRLNNYTIAVERKISNHYKPVTEATKFALEFNTCMLSLIGDMFLYFKRLKHTTIYVLQGDFFYYPKGAKTNDGTTHYNLKGVYSANSKAIIVSEDCRALKWELKNLYAYCYHRDLGIDIPPSQLGIGECME